MKILVTGSNGQLGSEIRTLSVNYPHNRFILTDLPELDITREEDVARMMETERPDVIINCAAYTAVDRAEQEPALARLLNASAPGILARAARSHDALLVHISTDYVFDGNNYRPYTESDPVSPVSVYGKSKLDGEREVILHAGRALIIRTSWLYSSFGANFVKTIRRYGIERGQLRVVSDQVGSPTYARDLAAAVLAMTAKPVSDGTEIYHYANEGITSWYDFARAIIDLSGIPCTVSPIATKDYPTPAARPFYSVFDKTKVKDGFGIEIPYWRDSLAACIRLIDAAENV